MEDSLIALGDEATQDHKPQQGHSSGVPDQAVGWMPRRKYFQPAPKGKYFS
jgi:hypothetical protein